MPGDPPDAITLYPDRRMAWAILVLSLVLAGLGGWLALARGIWPGYAALGVGLVVAAGCAVWLVPSRRYLHLTARGFIYSTRFNPRTVLWTDVARFGVAKVGGIDRVAWDYAPHYPADATARARSRAAVGYEALLPPCCRGPSGRIVGVLETHRQRSVP